MLSENQIYTLRQDSKTVLSAQRTKSFIDAGLSAGFVGVSTFFSHAASSFANQMQALESNALSNPNLNLPVGDANLFYDLQTLAYDASVGFTFAAVVFGISFVAKAVHGATLSRELESL